MHVQTFVRAWTGHLGNAIVAALDEEILWDRRAHGPKPFPKAKRLWTGIHSLQPARPRAYTRTSDEFYELADWIEGRIGARQTRRVTPALRSAYGPSRRARLRATQLRRQSDDIRVDRTLSAATKERRIEELYARIDAGLRDALPRMRLARGGG